MCMNTLTGVRAKIRNHYCNWLFFFFKAFLGNSLIFYIIIITFYLFVGVAKT